MIFIRQHQCSSKHLHCSSPKISSIDSHRDFDMDPLAPNRHCLDPPPRKPCLPHEYTCKTRLRALPDPCEKSPNVKRQCCQGLGTGDKGGDFGIAGSFKSEVTVKESFEPNPEPDTQEKQPCPKFPLPTSPCQPSCQPLGLPPYVWKKSDH